MYLKRLEIFGFKSFAEKTEMDYGPGITAVVGPNGSGKSNVADAIRWVLGEQSARALRGGQMSDVIFAGSDGKKAMGFAQVSLVLDNSDGKLKVPFNEVMVTRRVDRSGEGEYFLNQVPCRLKDVHDLFMDTGIGKESYSIIGQGRIDEVLSSKPEDRRALFEEAAGISRYKARKREAQRRLEETEQNLLRITDIIGELNTQIETLADQAKRAEAYTVLNEELTRLDVGLIAHALASVAARAQKQELDNLALQDRLAEIDARLTGGEGALETARTLAESLDQELAVVNTQLAEATGALERAEGHLALAAQSERTVQAEGGRLEAELAALEAKLTEAAAEITTLADQVARAQADLAAAQLDLAEREAAQQAAAADLAAAAAALDGRRADVASVKEAEAERQGTVAAAERAGEDAARRTARLEGERERAAREAGTVETAQRALADSQAALAHTRGQVAADLEALRARQAVAEQQLQQWQQKGSSLREQQGSVSARLNAIEEMAAQFEGYQKGTRTVLQGREKGLPFAADVAGAIAEVVRTEPRYEKALEVALGGAVQNIITHTDEGAKQAIEHLKRTGGGRATFLPLSVIRPASFRPDEEREFKGAPGLIGVALDLVRFDEVFRPAISSLLGRVLVADDMNAALAFGKRTGMRYRIVTLDGELLAAGGALTGGSLGGQGSGLLSREREREELAARIAAIKTELAEARTAYEAAAATKTQVEAALRAKEQELRGVETRVTQADAEAARLAGEAARWLEELARVAAETATVAEEAGQGAETALRLRQELAGLAGRREGLEAEAAILQEDVAARQAAVDERATAVTATRVRLAELNQALRGLEAQRQRAGFAQAALEGEKAAKQEQLAGSAGRLAQAAENLATAKAEVETAGTGKAEFEEQRNRLQTRKLEALEQVNNRERELRNLRRSQADASTKLQQGQVEMVRLEEEQKGLITRLDEQHGLTPFDTAGRALDDAEVPFARERTHALREEIRELGPVNLQAIADYRNAQERFVFLERQKADLEEAKGSLYRAVEELDKRIKTYFYDSFQVIRREFQRVYQELFEGGKADLLLVDENDLLETGVEIIAQPPGKKAQALGLLSGGERAMTAIALLFALLRVKPSPFVILDEVEAALDEANVERFGKYLRLFSATGCQFICITHQRGSMEVADALYGVTMEGTGVSKVVSVRLVDIEREAS